MSHIRRRMIGIVVGGVVASALAIGPVGALGGVEAASAYEEDPALQAIAAESVMADCEVSRARAMTILRVQDRGVEFDRRISQQRGVVDLYYRSCRPGLVVQVLRGTPRAPLHRLARRHGMARWVSFRSVRFTRQQIRLDRRQLSDRFERLMRACLATVSSHVQGNGLEVELSRDASADDVALVRQTIAASKVPVKLTRVRGSLCLDVHLDRRDPTDGPEAQPEPGPMPTT